MACTEVYTIRKKDARFVFYSEIPFAFTGAPLIWQTMEEKYLPSLFLDDDHRRAGFKYYSRFISGGRDKLHEVWALEYDPRLTQQERIVMSTTYDYAVIRKEDLLEVAEAYESMPWASENMKQRAKVFREIYASDDKTIAAVYTLETSVLSLGDIAYQKRSGNCYMTDKFYDVMAYQRDLSKCDYDIEKYKKWCKEKGL